jgi:hypothetical protein
MNSTLQDTRASLSVAQQAYANQLAKALKEALQIENLYFYASENNTSLSLTIPCAETLLEYLESANQNNVESVIADEVHDR